jgi:hypothetical protein
MRVSQVRFSATVVEIMGKKFEVKFGFLKEVPIVNLANCILSFCLVFCLGHFLLQLPWISTTGLIDKHLVTRVESTPGSCNFLISDKSSDGDPEIMILQTTDQNH